MSAIMRFIHCFFDEIAIIGEYLHFSGNKTYMKSHEGKEEVCTTQRAAEILGVSVSTVQQLVETGVIRAWKTTGGHRRIPLSEVMAYKSKPASVGSISAANGPAFSGERVSILVVEDSPMQRQLYEAKLNKWGLNATLAFCENGYQALIEIARTPPDILLVDIVMDGIDGYEVIKAIMCDEHLHMMDIAILSGIDREALEARGGLPPGVVFFSKPVILDELRGYLRACCAYRERRAKLLN